MDINISEQNDVLYFKNNKDEKIFLKYTLNFIFYFDNNTTKNIICQDNLDKELFETYFNKCYYLLIVGNNFKNTIITDYISSNVKLNLLKFVYLDIFYISGICKINNEIFIDFENIYYKNFKFNYKINSKENYLENEKYEWDNKNLYLLENNIKILLDEIEDFKIKIKEYTIDEMENKKTYINNLYQNLKNTIDKTDKIYDKLISKIKILEEEIKTKNKSLEDTNKYKYRDNYLESQNKYILTVLDLIDKLDKNKNNKLKELDKVNNDIDSKINNINILEDKIKNLENNIENIFNTKNTNNTKNIQKNNYIDIRPLGVFIHIFNILVWEDISKYINTLYKANYKFDLYINISSSDISKFKDKEYKELKEKIINNKIYQNIYITYSDNRGMDIGGFMISYIKMLEMNIGYENIIKIHTKTNNNWRFAMLYAILGNKNIIDNNFKLMKDSKIGMIGNQTMDLTNLANKKSYQHIHTYLKRFNVNFFNKGNFIPGTIFMIKGSVLRKFLNIQNLKDSYNEFEQDYCGSKINNREGKPHAFERFFGFMVEDCKMNTVTFDSSI